MAIFHLTAKVISRGKGQSAIAAAAYRSGERLYDEQAAQQKYYPSRDERIIFTDIMAPKDAPEWAHDRDQLWNQAERTEKRKDAQLAREIEVALPHELTDRQREWLVKDFAREQFVRRGYAVDIAIHAPDRTSDDRNHHAHLMISMRTLGKDGFAAKKDRDLNSSEQLGAWREQWAHLANRHLERHGHDARIDHRSLSAQGIDREPTVHVGYAGSEIAARGAQSDRMDALHEILARNEIRVDLKAIEAEIKLLETEQAAQQAREKQEAEAKQAAVMAKQAAQAKEAAAKQTAERVVADKAEAQRRSDEGQHRALLAASSARRRQQGWSQIGRAQAHAPSTTPQPMPVQPVQTPPPAPVPQNQNAAQSAQPPAVEMKPAVQLPQPTPVEKKNDREGWRWSEAWGWEKIEDAEAWKKQQQAAKNQAAPVPERATSKLAAPTPTPTQPQQQQWGYGTSYVQTPQGDAAIVPIEHIHARHAAAERANAEAQRQARAAAAPTPLERAAGQEEARQRYEQNYPYDQSRRLLSEGQQKQQDAWQARVAAQNPARINPVPVAGRAVSQVARSSLRVADKVTGAVSSLGDFVSNLLSGSSASPASEKVDMRRLATDPAYRKQHQLARLSAEHGEERSEKAIVDIAHDIEAGRTLRASDVAALTRAHQDQILAKGDAYVTQMIEASRKRADEYWKGRERERD